MVLYLKENKYGVNPRCFTVSTMPPQASRNSHKSIPSGYNEPPVIKPHALLSISPDPSSSTPLSLCYRHEPSNDLTSSQVRQINSNDLTSSQVRQINSNDLTLTGKTDHQMNAHLLTGKTIKLNMISPPQGKTDQTQMISPPHRFRHEPADSQMISSSYSIPSRPAKRKYPDSPNNSLTNVLLNGRQDILPIKQEPNSSFGGYLDCEEDYQYDPDSSNSGFMDSSYQVIKWQAFNVQKWTALTDSNLKDL
ncbi:Hypothetical predicted protein [Mytilus galloprovincialis]|uniref:Uncharacterized protein n=1 Tax=Mytilus galloprovincialis TaxID=29158 RepID=A0A8B6HEV0_MYTGA|nr:Hypothetical predicted protein [Mytilus galloprovincialis]